MYLHFTNLYEGDRPMACCGHGASPVVSRTQAYAPGAAKEIGAEGTSKVEYVGKRSAGESFTIFGFKTGTQYRVTPGRRFSVDATDLISKSVRQPGVLEMLESNQYMFRLVDEEPPKEVVDVPLPMPVVPDTEVPQEEEQGTDFTILNSGVAVLKERLGKTDFTETELTELIAYEMSHKNRRSAIAALEALRD
jgi:hypothetical protein